MNAVDNSCIICWSGILPWGNGQQSSWRKKQRCCLQVPLGHGILVENYRWWECSIYQTAFHFFGNFSGEVLWVHGSTSYWKSQKKNAWIFILDTRWWFLKISYFHPTTLGKQSNVTFAYFSNGLGKNHQPVTPLAAWRLFLSSHHYPLEV